MNTKWIKREHNRKTNTAELDEQGIKYTSHNSGAHLVIKHNKYVVDFWPGTAKYIFRGSPTYKYGVYSLIEDLST